MSKNRNQKLKLFYLKQILEEYTDADHGITMNRIQELLGMRGVVAERKSIYDDIDTLINDFDMDIQKPSGRDFTYKLQSREFDIAELKLIIDSVQSSKFLSVKSSREIIRKMEKLCSKHEASQLHRKIILTNRVKNEEDLISNNVGNINAAIDSGEQISFKYFDYSIQKRKTYRKKGALYTVSPYALLINDGNYYLLAYSDEAQDLRTYRVDRMKDVKPTGDAREGAEKLRAIFDSLELEVPTATAEQFEILKNSVNPVRLKNHPIALDVDTIDSLYHDILR